MGNTFTALAPTLFSAAKEVAQEPMGALDSINMNFDSKGVAIGDSVTVPVAPAAAVTTFTPAMTKAAGTDKIAESIAVIITANQETMWHLTGEQQKSLANAESDKEWVSQMIKQGMRSLRNAAEAAACSVIYKGASRAWGTPATTPFATTIDDIANIYKILKDNGAPMADLQMVIDTNAGLNARKLAIIQQADQAGTDAERRTGNFLRQFGFAIKESAGIASHTKGTMLNADSIAGGNAIGVTTVALEGSDSGTIIAGDVVTFSNHATVKYVINDPSTLSGAAAGNIIIGRPGLRTAIVDATEAVLGANYTANLAFERSAVVGVMRPPIIPPSSIISQMLITDDKGLSYLLCETVGFGMVTWSLHLAYGFKVINSEFVCNFIG